MGVANLGLEVRSTKINRSSGFRVFFVSFLPQSLGKYTILTISRAVQLPAFGFYEGWNFNSGNYLFTTDTK